MYISMTLLSFLKPVIGSLVVGFVLGIGCASFCD